MRNTFYHRNFIFLIMWNGERFMLFVRTWRLFRPPYGRKFLLIGVLIHVLFYASVLSGGWLNIFFSGSSTHYADPGIDFYQVVRGAWSWWHSGSLTGAALANKQVYAPALHYGVNTNVYSPLFTIVLGTVLMAFSPQAGYVAWIVIKMGLDVLLIGLFCG